MLLHTQDSESSPLTLASNRRTVLKGAVWSVPVLASTVILPAAAATNAIRSDLVLRFGETVEGSTRDISTAVIDLIERTIRSLGPQPPVAPELVLPPAPQRPTGNPFTNPAAWQAYAAAYAQWAIDVAQANADYAGLVAAYLQAQATYLAWDLAVRSIVSRLRAVALQSEGLFFASVTYPRSLSVVNNGPETIPAGTTITTQILTDINLINVYLPQVGAVQAVQTGGTTLLTHTTTTAIAPGSELFNQPLVYNPVAVTLNITGNVTPSSLTAMLSPTSQDTDVSDNGDIVTSPVGVRLDVATGDVQAILAEWRQFLDAAIAFYDLVSPFLPEIDWGSVISGVLPLSLPEAPAN